MRFLKYLIFLGCGWLMFGPPSYDKDKTFDTSQPLSKWEHLMSYDSAAACEQDIVNAIQKLPEIEKKKDYGSIFLKRNALGRCIPSDSIKFQTK